MNKVIDLFKRFTRKEKPDPDKVEEILLQNVADEVEDEILSEEERKEMELKAAKAEHHVMNMENLKRACALFDKIGIYMNNSETQEWLDKMSDFVLTAHPDKSLRFTVDELIHMGVQQCKRVTKRRARRVLEKYGFSEVELKEKMKAKRRVDGQDHN